MSEMKGKALRLPLARRMICDSLALSQSIPLAHGEHRIDIRPLKRAVEALRPPVHWQSVFLKAYAMVAAERPVLRRVYVPRPWGYLYEHPENIGSLVVSRKIDGENGLLYLPITSPEKRSIREINQLFKEARHKPVEEIRPFRYQLRFARLPWIARWPMYRLAMDWMPYRRVCHLGTFGMSVLASMGASTLSTFVPWTTMIHYTPFDQDGFLFIRMALDHRVLDGVECALAVLDLEKKLNGPILEEIQSMSSSRLAA